LFQKNFGNPWKSNFGNKSGSFTSNVIGCDLNVHFKTGNTLFPPGYSAYAAPPGPLGKFLSIGGDSSGFNVSVGIGIGSPFGGGVDIEASVSPGDSMTMQEQVQMWNDMGM
jgi:hypothetical protein